MSADKAKPSPYQRPHDDWQYVSEQEAASSEQGDRVSKRRMPSLRTQRGRLVFWSLLASGGLLTTMLTSSRRTEFVNPGPLTSAHARLLTDANRCQDCHEADLFSSAKAEAGGQTAALADAFRTPHKGMTQTQLCLKCHGDALGMQYANHAHGASPEELTAITQRSAALDASPGARDGAPITKTSFTQQNLRSLDVLACAVCHKEHHGREFNLSQMTNAQCQTCHAQQFKSFAEGHPDIVDWTIRTPARIAFDHASHKHAHFPQKQQEFDCRTCHQGPDLLNTSSRPDGIAKSLPFESSCAACHAEGIQAAMKNGLTVVELPTLPPAALEKNAKVLNDWPESHRGELEGSVSPWLELLLQSDESAVAALREVRAAQQTAIAAFANGSSKQTPGSSLSLEVKSAKHAAVIAASIRKLLQEVEQQGSLAVENRWRKAFPHASEEERALLTPPADLVTVSAKWWFAKASPLSVSSPVTLTEEAASTAKPAIPAPANKPLPSVKTRIRLVEPQEWRLDEASEKQLKELSMQFRLGGQSGASAATPAEVESPGESPSVKRTLKDPKPAGELAKRDALSSSHAVAQTVRPPSGWRADLNTGRIWYQPTGHADPVLTAAMNIALSHESEANAAIHALKAELLGETGLGRCNTCHISSQATERPTVFMEWKSAQKTARSSHAPATFFSHKPHLSQALTRDCQYCHEIAPAKAPSNDAGASTPVTQVSYGPTTTWHRTRQLTTGLVSLHKGACVNCHTKTAAGDDCTLCHKYHWLPEAARKPPLAEGK